MDVNEYQLLSFFGVDPELRDSGVLWCYNDAVYEIQQSGILLKFSIAPAYRDVRIIVECDGRRLYEFNGIEVQNVRYNNDSGVEQLEVLLHDQEMIVLKLKPHIHVSQTRML